MHSKCISSIVLTVPHGVRGLQTGGGGTFGLSQEDVTTQSHGAEVLVQERRRSNRDVSVFCPDLPAGR